jgi:hypothetical protein
VTVALRSVPSQTCSFSIRVVRHFRSQYIQGEITFLRSHLLFSRQHHNAASRWGGGEGSRLQSQGDQDLCGPPDADHLIFKTSTEEWTVDLTNKGMTKDSQRFSRWFHSVWRTTGPILHYSVKEIIRTSTSSGPNYFLKNSERDNFFLFQIFLRFFFS